MRKKNKSPSLKCSTLNNKYFVYIILIVGLHSHCNATLISTFSKPKLATGNTLGILIIRNVIPTYPIIPLVQALLDAIYNYGTSTQPMLWCQWYNKRISTWGLFSFQHFTPIWDRPIDRMHFVLSTTSSIKFKCVYKLRKNKINDII